MPDPRRPAGLTRVYRVEEPTTGLGPYGWSNWQGRLSRPTGVSKREEYRRQDAMAAALDTPDNEARYNRLQAGKIDLLSPAANPGQEFTLTPGVDKVAFTSRANYEAWFTPQQRANLGKLGFKLRAYDVPTTHLKHDAVQAAFPGKLGHATDEPGHWVTIDGHPVFLKE